MAGGRRVAMVEGCSANHTVEALHAIPERLGLPAGQPGPGPGCQGGRVLPGERKTDAGRHFRGHRRARTASFDLDRRTAGTSGRRRRVAEFLGTDQLPVGADPGRALAGT